MICPDCNYANKYNDGIICAYCGYNMLPTLNEIYRIAERFGLLSREVSSKYDLMDNEFIVGSPISFKEVLRREHIPYHTKIVYGLQVIIVDL